jgi:N-acetylmuramoyl-L-alanine amidase
VSYDTGIAARLRSFGVRVVECDGWQTRGSSSFTPRGSVNHHTAGGANGACPSLSTVIHGRPDLAGPLANVLQSREPDGNDIAYVVAAGRANHAGSGGWRGLSGNSSVYGLEIEHTGTSSIPEGRRQIAARIHAAMIAGLAAPDPGYVCQHYEWTTRKIDLATEVNPDGWRQRVADALAGGSGGDTPEDWFDMATKKDLEDVVKANNNQIWATRVDNLGTSSGAAADYLRKIKPSTDQIPSTRTVVWAQDVANLPTNAGAAADYLRKIMKKLDALEEKVDALAESR